LLVLVTYMYIDKTVGIYSVCIYRIKTSPNYQLLVSFTYKMAAKELKALVDFGISLGYNGEDLKQWLNDIYISYSKRICTDLVRKRLGRIRSNCHAHSSVFLTKLAA